jgi:hypothetical protein
VQISKLKKNSVNGEPLWLSGKVMEWDNKNEIKRSRVRSLARATKKIKKKLISCQT